MHTDLEGLVRVCKHSRGSVSTLRQTCRIDEDWKDLEGLVITGKEWQGLARNSKDLQGFVKGSCEGVFLRSSKELQGFV